MVIQLQQWIQFQFKEGQKMAKMTKKQEAQYVRLVALHHEMIRAKHFNNRADYENVVEKIREEVKEDDEK